MNIECCYWWTTLGTKIPFNASIWSSIVVQWPFNLIFNFSFTIFIYIFVITAMILFMVTILSYSSFSRDRIVIQFDNRSFYWDHRDRMHPWYITRVSSRYLYALTCQRQTGIQGCVIINIRTEWRKRNSRIESLEGMKGLREGSCSFRESNINKNRQSRPVQFNINGCSRRGRDAKLPQSILHKTRLVGGSSLAEASVPLLWKPRWRK